MYEQPVKKATVRDVAREAQVSVASVSRALNGMSSVTAETRDRIRAVADQLGYVPHAGARSLSLSRSNVIGAVLPDLHGEFFSELIRGMDRATVARGYQMLFSTMHADLELARHAILAMNGRVDGLILMAPQFTAVRLAALLPPLTPTVLINSVELHDRDSLRIDNRRGAAAMTRYLLQSGRRSILHISGPADNIDAQQRCEGVRDAFEDTAPDLAPIIVEGDFRQESGARAAEEVLRNGAAIDAIFAGNDDMALGALWALRTGGKRVPEDIAVAGFDDVPLARYLGLTTMRVPVEQIGDGAVSRLLEHLEGKTMEKVSRFVTPELVLRETTGAAR